MQVAPSPFYKSPYAPDIAWKTAAQQTASIPFKSVPVDQKLIQATCKIQCGGNGGSGICIWSDTTKIIVLTNHHVSNGYSTGKAWFPSGTSNLKLIGWDAGCDVAVLQGTPLPIEAISLASNHPKKDEEICQVGYPTWQGSQHLVTRKGSCGWYGWVGTGGCDWTRPDKRNMGLKLNSRIFHGDSGSPVFFNGKVTGLTWGSIGPSKSNLTDDVAVELKDIQMVVDKYCLFIKKQYPPPQVLPKPDYPQVVTPPNPAKPSSDYVTQAQLSQALQIVQANIDKSKNDLIEQLKKNQAAQKAQTDNILLLVQEVKDSASKPGPAGPPGPPGPAGPQGPEGKPGTKPLDTPPSGKDPLPSSTGAGPSSPGSVGKPVDTSPPADGAGSYMGPVAWSLLGAGGVGLLGLLGWLGMRAVKRSSPVPPPETNPTEPSQGTLFTTIEEVTPA